MSREIDDELAKMGLTVGDWIAYTDLPEFFDLFPTGRKVSGYARVRSIGPGVIELEERSRDEQ